MSSDGEKILYQKYSHSLIIWFHTAQYDPLDDHTSTYKMYGGHRIISVTMLYGHAKESVNRNWLCKNQLNTVKLSDGTLYTPVMI